MRSRLSRTGGWMAAGVVAALTMFGAAVAVAGPEVMAKRGVTCGMVAAGANPIDLVQIDRGGESANLACSAKDMNVQCVIIGKGGQEIGKAIPLRTGGKSSLTFRVYPGAGAPKAWSDATGHYDIRVSLAGLGEDDFLHALRNDTAYKLEAAPR